MTLTRVRILCLAASIFSLAPLAVAVRAQEAPTESADQLSWLKDKDPKLARNKKFVFDFWRIVYEGRHLDEAPRYMDAGYIQHNPNVPSGRAAFVDLFSKKGPPLPIEPLLKMHVINIIADGNYVTVSTIRRMRDTRDPNHIYSTTWFDMFRIDARGMIAEHWDPSPMWIDGKPPGAEFLP